MTMAARSSVGLMAYHAGRAAEDQVARLYERRGQRVCARRWRGASGEIDLIIRDNEGLIFVEVKRGRTHQAAVSRITAAQMRRVSASALDFVANEPFGVATAMRFDVATVDEIGRIEIIENALAV